MAGGIYRLVYRSALALPGGTEEGAAALEAILETSRRNNAPAGITGALLHSGAQVVQVLEGPLDALEAVFDRIASDLRHTALELLQFTPAAAPCFPGWSMAYVPQRHMDGLLGFETIRAEDGPEAIEAALATVARILAGEAEARAA